LKPPSFDSYYFHTHGDMPPDALTSGMEHVLAGLLNNPALRAE